MNSNRINDLRMMKRKIMTNYSKNDEEEEKYEYRTRINDLRMMKKRRNMNIEQGLTI